MTPSRGRILIVDDDGPLATTLGRWLGKRYDVTALFDPNEACSRIVAGERFDVILCDLMMPGGTAIDLYDTAIRIAPDQAARIVFITGGAFTANARAFLDVVPNAKLEKPFEMEELLGAIDLWMTGARRGG